MTQVNYIDLDSTYRDRNKYPNPSSFAIPISTATTSNIIADPICNAMPSVAWTSRRFTVGQSLDNIQGSVITNKSATDIVHIQYNGAGIVQEAPDYYAGAIVGFTITKDHRRVWSSTYVGDNMIRLLLDIPILIHQDTELGTLLDPTDFADPAYTQIFVPGGQDIQNIYTGDILFNETRGSWRTINTYSRIDHTVQVDTRFTDWTALDSYSIRSEIPTLSSTINSSMTTVNRVQLTTGFHIPATVYDFAYIRIPQLVYGNEADANAGIARRVVAWDAVNQLAYVNPPFPTIPKFNCEVMAISGDNCVPYSNIRPKDATAMSFEIQLISLHIPNTPIFSSLGGNPLNYPYLYVRLSNVTRPQTSNLSASNNPSASRVQFRATLAPQLSANESYFFKLTGDETHQTIQLDTNDTLIFELLLPDGQLWIPAESDTVSPSPPNPLLQIAAYFSFRART